MIFDVFGSVRRCACPLLVTAAVIVADAGALGDDTARWPAAPPLAQVDGPPNARYGQSIAAIGDVNGDGVPDLAVGAPGGGKRSQGVVLIVSGRDGKALRTHTGERPRDQFGISVAALGDVDDDGIGDFAVGASSCDIGGRDAGAVYVFSGGSGKRLHRMTGPKPYVFFGVSVADAGDIDDDGRHDVLVGCLQDGTDDNPQTGSVRTYSSADGSLLFVRYGDAQRDMYGRAVGGGRDVNGDGVPDALVGIVQDDTGGIDAGAVCIDSLVTGERLRAVIGSAGADRLGYSVAWLGDLDGDGVDDFVAGAPGRDVGGDCAGGALVVSGASGKLIRTHEGHAAGDEFGYAVASGGDVDGDGIIDVLIGASQEYSAGPGYARVHSGADGALLWESRGRLRDERHGSTVGTLGDVNGDGADEFVVTSLAAGSSKRRHGSLFIHAGVFEEGDR